MNIFHQLFQEKCSGHIDISKIVGAFFGVTGRNGLKAERSRQGVGTGHESSNFAAPHYLT